MYIIQEIVFLSAYNAAENYLWELLLQSLPKLELINNKMLKEKEIDVRRMDSLELIKWLPPEHYTRRNEHNNVHLIIIIFWWRTL